MSFDIVDAILTPCITVHLQIEEISRRLRTGDLGIAPNPEDRLARDWFPPQITTLLFSVQEPEPVICVSHDTRDFHTKLTYQLSVS